MPAVAKGMDTCNLVAPPDRTGRKGVEKDLPQFATEHLRATAGAVVGLIGQYRPILVKLPYGLTSMENQTLKFFCQACHPQSDLSIVIVDIEHPTLRPRRR